MEAYREIIDAKLLLSIMKIPNTVQTQKFEVIAFPVLDCQQETPENAQKKHTTIDGKYSFSTKNFKFNRDEANDYD